MAKILIIMSFLMNMFFTALGQAQQKSDKESDCDQYRRDAQKSITSGRIEYKRFGMPIDLLSKDAQIYLNKKYNLFVIQMGCVVIPGEQCYNEEIDNYILKQYKRHVYELIEEAKLATKK